jgi:hypothetical protein
MLQLILTGVSKVKLLSILYLLVFITNLFSALLGLTLFLF